MIPCLAEPFYDGSSEHELRPIPSSLFFLYATQKNTFFSTNILPVNIRPNNAQEMKEKISFYGLEENCDNYFAVNWTGNFHLLTSQSNKLQLLL